MMLRDFSLIVCLNGVFWFCFGLVLTLFWPRFVLLYDSIFSAGAGARFRASSRAQEAFWFCLCLVLQVF